MPLRQRFNTKPGEPISPVHQFNLYTLSRLSRAEGVDPQ